MLQGHQGPPGVGGREGIGLPRLRSQSCRDRCTPFGPQEKRPLCPRALRPRSRPPGHFFPHSHVPLTTAGNACCLATARRTSGLPRRTVASSPSPLCSLALFSEAHDSVIVPSHNTPTGSAAPGLGRMRPRSAPRGGRGAGQAAVLRTRPAGPGQGAGALGWAPPGLSLGLTVPEFPSLLSLARPRLCVLASSQGVHVGSWAGGSVPHAALSLDPHLRLRVSELFSPSLEAAVALSSGSCSVSTLSLFALRLCFLPVSVCVSLCASVSKFLFSSPVPVRLGFSVPLLFPLCPVCPAPCASDPCLSFRPRPHSAFF